MSTVGVSSNQSVPYTSPYPSGAQQAPPPGQSAAPSYTDQSSAATTARGSVPAGGVTMPAGDDMAWAMLMEIKHTAGMGVSGAEQARYQQIAGQVQGGGAAGGSMPAGATDASQAGNISWAMLMEIKHHAGMGLSAAEQARYQSLAAAIQGSAPQPGASPMAGGVRTIPTELGAAGPTGGPQPMTQAEYDKEVKWAVSFEKSEPARRYNAFKTEHNVRTGRAEGSPKMDDAKYRSEMAWAEQFAQSADIQRYKRVSAEVQRRQAAGESTKPTSMIGRAMDWAKGLWNRFTNRGTQPAGT